MFGDAWPREDRIYHAPLDEIGPVTEPVAILDSSWLPGGNAVQHLAVSATAVAAEVQLAGYIALVEDGVLGRLIDADSAVRGTPQRLQMVGSTVYWTDYAAKARIARGSLSEPESHYLEVDGADVVGGQVDGEWVAWQQATRVGGPYTAAELWAAPYSEDPASLAPRLVRTLEGYRGPRMGEGIYAFRRGNDRVELHDLVDGRRRLFRMPAGHVIADPPLYVRSDEMLVATRVDGRPSLLRVQLASLPYEE